MKIVLAVDGSTYMEMSTRMLTALELPNKTEVTVMTVIPEVTFLGGLTLQHLKSQIIRGATIKPQERAAEKLLQEQIEMQKKAGIATVTKITHGKPAESILKVSQDTAADLIIIGAKGLNNSSRFRLGSVAHKIIRYSNTSVLVTREKPKKLRSVLIATDGSSYADETVHFLLNLPLPLHTRVVLVTSLESHISGLLIPPHLI